MLMEAYASDVIRTIENDRLNRGYESANSTMVVSRKGETASYRRILGDRIVRAGCRVAGLDPAPCFERATLV